MKKKVLSLLLVVTLMFAFTVNVYASNDDATEDSVGLRESLFLHPQPNPVSKTTQSFDIQSTDMNPDDNRLSISIEVYTSTPKYLFQVYDKTQQEIVVSQIFNANNVDHSFGNVINYQHDYTVSITNIGDIGIIGTMLLVID